MIKLTRSYYAEGMMKVGQPVWLSPSHIQMVELVDVGGVRSTEITVMWRTISVVETPEDIMMLPEMVYYAYPAMVLG